MLVYFDLFNFESKRNVPLAYYISFVYIGNQVIILLNGKRTPYYRYYTEVSTKFYTNEENDSLKNTTLIRDIFEFTTE